MFDRSKFNRLEQNIFLNAGKAKPLYKTMMKKWFSNNKNVNENQQYNILACETMNFLLIFECMYAQA